MYLMLHSEKYRLVQQEVDQVVGKELVSVEHLSKLPYTYQRCCKGKSKVAAHWSRASPPTHD